MDMTAGQERIFKDSLASFYFYEWCEGYFHIANLPSLYYKNKHSGKVISAILLSFSTTFADVIYSTHFVKG